MPFVSVLSRNLIRGIETWPVEFPANMGERRNTIASVSRTPGVRCVISRSKKLGDVRDPGGAMIRFSAECCLKAGPTFEAGVAGSSIHVQRVAIRFVFIFVSPFHGLLEFLFKNAVTIFHRVELLGKNL